MANLFGLILLLFPKNGCSQYACGGNKEDCNPKSHHAVIACLRYIVLSAGVRMVFVACRLGQREDFPRLRLKPEAAMAAAERASRAAAMARPPLSPVLGLLTLMLKVVLAVPSFQIS